MDDSRDGDAQGRRLPDLTASQRIGDAERARAAAALSEHYAAGRLDRAEFDVRTDAALTARTGADLEPLFRDLPLTGAPILPKQVTAKAPRQTHRHFPLFPLVPIAVVLVLILASPEVFAFIGRTGFPFIILPILWFSGAFRRRRWHH